MNAVRRTLRAAILVAFTTAGIAWGLTNALISLANGKGSRR